MVDGSPCDESIVGFEELTAGMKTTSCATNVGEKLLQDVDVEGVTHAMSCFSAKA